jgi:hypothetical protein
LNYAAAEIRRTLPFPGAKLTAAANRIVRRRGDADDPLFEPFGCGYRRITRPLSETGHIPGLTVESRQGAGLSTLIGWGVMSIVAAAAGLGTGETVRRRAMPVNTA